MIYAYSLGKRNNSIKQKIANYLAIIFFIHGALYFLKPSEIYNLNNPLKYIKYIVLISILMLALNRRSLKRVVLYLLVVAAIIMINLIALGGNLNLISVFVYIFPLSVYFFYDELSKYLDVKKIISISYVVASVFAYVEFFILQGVFPRFASLGYRVVSIYVNPNNFGLVVVVFTACMLNRGMGIFRSCLIVANSALLIFLSGSRTALVAYGMVLMMYFLNYVIKILLLSGKIKTKFILSFLLFVIVISGLVLSLDVCIEKFWQIFGKLRSIDSLILSMRIRLGGYSAFLASDNLVFPWQKTMIYVDNIYLHVWGMFGLIMLVFWGIFNICLLFVVVSKRQFDNFNLLLIFIVGGLSTNWLYLWPLAYCYWYIVGRVLSQCSSTSYCAK